MQNTKTNSANSASQPPDTASNGNNPTRTRANRRIDIATISEIARLCARQLSESEACRKISVRPQAWFSWKSRHNRSEKFAALLEEFRAGRIDDLISKIEKSADGVGMKQPDWRAAAALLKFADMKRFGDSPAVEINNAFAPILTDAQIAKVEAMFLKSKAIASAPVPKQIQAAEIVPELQKMSDAAKPDLKSQPRELTVSGKDIFIIDEIKLRGGYVCGMAQEKQNGQWKLSIHWPERALFAE